VEGDFHWTLLVLKHKLVSLILNVDSILFDTAITVLVDLAIHSLFVGCKPVEK